MRSPLLLHAVLAAILLCAARPALADEVARARAHFDQGEAYFKAGAYDRAIEEYQTAYDLAPRSALLFNIGLSHEQLGDTEQAIAFYDRYLAEEPDGVKAAEARARREALTRTLEETQKQQADRTRAAELRHRAAELSAAGDHAGAVAAMDEARRLDSDPEMIFELAEIHRRAGETVLALTEYRRYLATVDTGIHRSDAARRIDELEAARTREAVPPRPPPPQPVEPPGRRSLVPALVGYGAAVVFAGAGIYYGTQSRSDLSDIDDALASGDPPLDSGDPRFDDGRNSATRANVAFALAGVSVTAAAILTAWALWPRSTPGDRDQTALVPVVSPGLAGAALEVTW